MQRFTNNYTMIKIKDSHLTINVENIEKSINFYECIGFTLKERWGNHYALIAAPGIKIGLHPTIDINILGNSGHLSIGFTTEDFEKTKSTLRELEIELKERTEEGGKFIFFNDPDGTSLYFIQPAW